MLPVLPRSEQTPPAPRPTRPPFSPPAQVHNEYRDLYMKIKMQGSKIEDRTFQVSPSEGYALNLVVEGTFLVLLLRLGYWLTYVPNKGEIRAESLYFHPVVRYTVMADIIKHAQLNGRERMLYWFSCVAYWRWCHIGYGFVVFLSSYSWLLLYKTFNDLVDYAYYILWGQAEMLPHSLYLYKIYLKLGIF